MVRRRNKIPPLMCGERIGLRSTGCLGECHPIADERLRGGSVTEGSPSCCRGLMAG